MLDRLIQVCHNVKRLDENKILEQVFEDKDIQLDIANLNRDQMYEQGIDSKGESLGEYSQFTVGEKIKKGQRYDHVTLRDSGYMQDSIEVKSEKQEVVISADMKKPDTDLEAIFPNALGLTDENLQKIQGFIFPEVRKKVLEDILA